MIVAKVPLRISLLGGGTDLPNIYKKIGGGVISFSITKYLYVGISAHSGLFDEKYRLNYSDTERVSERDEISNGIVRSCLEYLKIDENLYVWTYSEVPSGSGLGSSSALAVGLLGCLHTLSGEKISNAQLAREACHVELITLDKPIGIQDQYGCALGGFNELIFEDDNDIFSPTVRSLAHHHQALQAQLERTRLIWIGSQRSADLILKDQLGSTVDKWPLYETYNRLREQMSDELATRGVDFSSWFASCLSQSYALKRQFADSIVTESCALLEERLRALGVRSMKLLGAGGGGFFVVSAEPEVLERVDASDTFTSIPFQLDSMGATFVAL